MDSPIRRSDVMTSHADEFAVPSPDRFARTDGRPHRTAPLTRRIEVASLLPTFETSYIQATVPRAPLFDATCTAIARGTVLRTRNGPTAIEDLMPGDFLETSRGHQPVVWIAATEWRAGLEPIPLLRVTAHGLGFEKPDQDCIFGPAARLRHAPAELSDNWGSDGILSPLGDFEDGDAVVTVTPPAPVGLYHVALQRHATFRAGGLEIESYHPGPSARDLLTTDARERLIALFPHLSSLSGFGPMCLPRVSRNARGNFSL